MQTLAGTESRFKKLSGRFARRLKSAPFSWRYAVVGAILGLGSPYGLLVLRILGSLEGGFAEWLRTDLDTMKWIYLYTGMGSVTVFSLFGCLMGKREDSLLKHARSVEGTAQTFERLSITDGLTNVYVHSYLLNRLDEEFSRAKRYTYPLGCLFIDIDNFKALNDQHGHVFGDLVLAEIAKVLSKEVRDTDILGRYGGDEFLAILPQTDAADAYKVAERIRKAVETLRLQTGSVSVYATISVGVYAPEQLPSKAKEVLELADSALHQAKNVGRNRSVLLVKEGYPQTVGDDRTGGKI